MGSKASTSASPSDEDSSPSRHQVYTRAERGERDGQDSLSSGCRTTVHQQQPQRSFIERAEHSLHSLMYNSNSSGVDIQRSNHATEFGSPPAAVSQSAGSSSRQSGYIPAAANNHNTTTRTGHDSNSSSIGSNTTTGLSHFLSNFNLWRASAGQPSGTTAERQRSTSLSHVSADQSRNYASVEGATADESSALSSPRAALTRLLSSRDGRNSCAHPGGESSGSSSSSSGSSNSSHQHHHHIQNSRPRRDSSTTNSATTTAFSMRDLTFATAQEFLAEATMNGMGLGRVYVTHSLPSHMWTVNGIKCPVCSKFVMPDDIECHLVMCLTKPRLNYNEDVLTEDKDECVICLEDLLKGHVIARLPCLCVYHKSCIDQWFDVNRSCPEHPSD